MALTGTKSIEAAAVAWVMELERRAGRQPTDKRYAKVFPGDIWSPPRTIELKASGTSFRGWFIPLEPSQLRAAQRDPQFYVYVVENVAQGDPAAFTLKVLHGDRLRHLAELARERRYYEMPWPIKDYDTAPGTEALAAVADEGWTYYKWFAGPDFQTVGGLQRWGREAQRYDPPTRSWVTIPGDALIASEALGDPTMETIGPDEAEVIRRALDERIPLMRSPAAPQYRELPDTDGPRRIIVMKVGVSDGEEWEHIVARKLAEERRAGVAYWGYGGSVCHPVKQVRPFALEAEDEPVAVLLIRTLSADLGPWVAAAEASIDRVTWEPVPAGVLTTGRYALVLRHLRPTEEWLDVGAYEVGIGPKRGTPLADYFRGRVDKACARLASARHAHDRRALVMRAELVSPYAVVLRAPDHPVARP